MGQNDTAVKVGDVLRSVSRVPDSDSISTLPCLRSEMCYSPGNVVCLTDNPDGASVRAEDLRDVDITANRERADEREQGQQGEEEDSLLL